MSEALITRRGGGGTELNFSVVGGTTRPTKPKENTIWVNTGQEITGWSFSALEPAEPAEGMVWFYTNVTSAAPFNALKEKDIQVYPFSAKQYVGGTWTNVTAESYLNGEWVGWLVFLYKTGDQYVERTGGWRQYDDSSYYATGNVAFYDASMRLYYNGKAMSAVSTCNKIDFTNVNTVNVLHVNNAGKELLILVKESIDDTARENEIAAQCTSQTGLVSLDVSGVKGEYYLCLRATSYNYNNDHSIKEVYLE